MIFNQNILIREASENDIPIIFSLINQLAEYENIAHEVVATKENLKKALFFKPHIAEVILGCYNYEPVGYALFFEKFSAFLGGSALFLDNIYVHPDFRSKGIGNAMMTYLVKSAKKRNCHRLEWWVLNRNQHAIKFYKKFNSIPMNEWTVHRLATDTPVMS